MTSIFVSSREVTSDKPNSVNIQNLKGTQKSGNLYSKLDQGHEKQLKVIHEALLRFQKNHKNHPESSIFLRSPKPVRPGWVAKTNIIYIKVYRLLNYKSVSGQLQESVSNTSREIKGFILHLKYTRTIINKKLQNCVLKYGFLK